MKTTKRINFIRQKVLEAKEALLQSIAVHFEISLPIKLVTKDAIFLGAQGCFEGDKIKINRDLPLFWQLIILEHEIGHVKADHKHRSGIIFQRFTTHHLSTEERRAWDWVEENPIMKGGVVDREVKKYIESLGTIGRQYGHVAEVMQIGWWY